MNDELYNIDIYAGLLKMSNDFEAGKKHPTLNYDTQSTKLTKLRQNFGLEKAAGRGSDFERALSLMLFVSKNVSHDPDYDNHVPSDSISLFEYSLKMGSECGVNCRALAVILTECLLSLGFYARTVYIMPLSPYDLDNHVVTHVYIPDMGKWVMLDPTFTAYVCDEDKKPMNLIEIRNSLSEKKQVFFNDEINYNGRKKLAYGRGKITIDSFYSEYLAKNLFFFETYSKSCFGIDKMTGNSVCALVPRGFDIERFKIANMEYRIEQCEDQDQLGALIEQYTKIRSGEFQLKKRIPISVDTFLRIPNQT